jgi:hypothetical protein
MPLFDESAYDVGTEEDEDAAEQIVSELDEQDIDEELREAEKKLTKAAYYKALVTSGVVEDDGTDAAAEVNAEASLWARQQMAKLLGREPKAAPAPVKIELPFNEKEIQALKRLAGRALEMAGERAAEPVVRPVTAPPVPTVRTVASKPKPQPRPVASKPQPKKPAAKVPPKKPAPSKKPAKGELDYDAIPSGEVFTDADGAQYKFVDNRNYDPSIEGSKARVKIKVTNQVRDIQAIPMPQGEAMSAITANQAAQSVARLEAIEASGNPTDQNAVVQAIKLSQR